MAKIKLTNKRTNGAVQKARQNTKIEQHYSHQSVQFKKNDFIDFTVKLYRTSHHGTENVTNCNWKK